MLKKLRFADYVCIVSVIGLATTFTPALLLHLIDTETPISDKFQAWIQISHIGFYLFLACSILLWFRAIAVAANHHNFTFERLFIAVAGNVFTAYLFYFLYRKREDYLFIEKAED
jgi:cytochrome bd-type quinol oxidase subunit 2